MNHIRASIHLPKLARIALVAATATLLVAGVLETPAGAAGAGPPYATKTVVTSSVPKVVTGQAVTFTATVLPPKSGHPPTPQGQVVFTITGSDSSTINCDAANTVSLGAGGTAVCSVSGGLLAAASPYTVSAAYTDTVDSNDEPSSGTFSQTVRPGPTTTALTSSSDPSVTGQGVTLTAAVALSGASVGTLTGSVTFGGVTCDAGNTVPVSGGLAQCPIAAGLLASGSPYIVTATYGNDPNFATSTSKALKQTVGLGSATVVLGASPNTCTGDLCTTSQGTALTFTATASANIVGAPAPTGSISFSIVPAGQKTSASCDGGNTVPLSGGQASCSIANGLPASVYYTVTATLSDPNYSAATATLYENTQEEATNTVLSEVKGVGAGETFNVTATVTPIVSGPNAPTGYVDITVCGGNSNGSSGCQGGNVPVGAGGTATFEVGGGEFTGSYYEYATYSGDQNYYGSVAKRKLIHIDLSPTSIAVSSSENASVDGDPVLLTASLTTPNGSAGSTLVGPPSGSLVFTITGPSGTVSCEGGNTVALNNGEGDEGTATCYLPPGTLTDPAAPGSTTYTVNVAYTTDGNYASSATNFKQIVVPLVS
ncbi:MAG: Ig-like domain repeat protein [Acidimicrobiales bacterium]